MTYVDDARLPLGRMRMAHLIADTHGELMRMALALGVSARHVQKRGTPEEHFDVCMAKRTLAIHLGAIEVETRELIRLIRMKRRTIRRAPAIDRESVSTTGLR